MALSPSPSIVTNGLTFYYDMSNTQKSWRGAPITNYIPNALASWNGSSFVLGYNYANLGATYTYATGVDNPVGSPGVLEYYTGTTGYKYFSIDSSTLPSTGTYTFSYYARMKPSGTSVSNSFGNSQLWRANGSDRSVTGDWNPTITSEWKRYTTTGPAEVGTILQYFPVHSGSITGGYTIQYCGFQLEVGSYATPFVAGTRSSTQAVFDLTGQNTTTATALTYSSNGTFSFNNTQTAIISIPDSTAIRPTSVTLSTWVFMPVYNPLNDFDGSFPTIAWKGFDGQYGSQASYALTLAQTGGLPRLTIAPNTLVSATPMATNVWVNIVGTYTAGGAMVLYRNGVVDTTGTGPTSISYSAQNFGVGTRTFSGAYQYPWNGQISVVQLYNRALSAAEVQQNFQALRGRYGI